MVVTSESPNHRIVVALLSGEGDEARPGLLPRVVAGLCFTLIGALMLYFLSVGTMEGRVLYVVGFLVGLINPVWGLYSLALMGAMYLLDQQQTHLLAGIEVLVLGVFAGELRFLLAGRRSASAAVGELAARDTSPGHPAVYWGSWPHWLAGFLLLGLGSALAGAHYIIFQRNPGDMMDNFWLRFLAYTYYYAATHPQWTAKSLYNWTTGVLLAIVVARHATPLMMARWLKIGAMALLVACFFGVLDWPGSRFWVPDSNEGVLPLTQIRRPNPDPLQIGRLQGPAGHPGWFAEWIVLMWPGLFLMWSAGRNKRNTLVAGALAFVGLTLVLTAARAGWLAALVTGGIAIVYFLRTMQSTREQVKRGIVAMVIVVLAGTAIGGTQVAGRLSTLLRAQDRANYYVSGFQFLRDQPLGIGLGMHAIRYEDRFLPTAFRYFQTDHVTSHSLWLHTLIENGPGVPLMLLAGVLCLGWEVRRAWPRFDPGAKPMVLATALSFLSIVVVSVTQYSFYLRIIEVSFWLLGGALVGMSRSVTARTDMAPPSLFGPRLLLACGLLSVAIAASHFKTNAVERPPVWPLPDAQDPRTLTFWTGTSWRTPVDPDIDRISFYIYRAQVPVSGTIRWPDGKKERFSLPAEGRQEFTHEFTPRQGHWYDKPHLLKIDCSPQWVASNYFEGAGDHRRLGIYIGQFRVHRSLNPEGSDE